MSLLATGALCAEPAPDFTVTPQARTADDQLYQLVRNWSFMSYLSPLNLQAEQERFYDAYQAGEVYNPKFQYLPISANVAHLRDALLAWKQPAGPLGELLAKCRDSRLHEVEAVLARDDPQRFFELAIKLFGVPTGPTVELAERWLRTPVTTTTEARLDPEVVERRIQAALQERHLKGWSPAWSSEIRSLYATNPAARQILLRAGGAFTESAVQCAIQFEIVVHAQRSESARRMPLKMLRSQWPGAAQTEEGLGVAALDLAKLLDPGRRKLLGGYVVAISRGAESFHTLYRLLLEAGLNEKDSFAVARRVKSGLTDTSRPGALTKDHVYLSGYLEVMDFFGRGHRLEELVGLGFTGLEHVAVARALLGQ